MYYSPTKLRKLYHGLEAKNKCLIKKANRISLIYLRSSSSMGAPTISLVKTSEKLPIIWTD